LLPSAKNQSEPKAPPNGMAWPRRFLRLSHQQRILLLEASVLLIAARLGIKALPFRIVVAISGRCVRADHSIPEDAALPNDAAVTAMRIGWAVRCAARRLPFEFVCLPQAMTANWMLRRPKLRPVLHLGVKVSSNAPMQAHAWLDCAGFPVTGYPVSAEFGEVAKFL